MLYNTGAGVELCDNGANNGPGAACNAMCQLNVCGDGDAGPDEQCDDGNMEAGDGCTACKLEECGNAIVDPAEMCDDGANGDNDDGCTDDCKEPACGDGFVQMSLGETCDLAGENSNSGACTLMCKDAACGDGNVQMDVEECDDGNMVETDMCLATCKAAKCGDGKVHAGVEQCDDGNMVDNDACSNACKLTIAKSYSAQFTGGQTSPAQCGTFNTFRASIAAGGYTKVTLRGNLDMVGKVCNGANANTLCQNLKNGTATSLACDGNTWMIGNCGGGIEISTTGNICSCNVGHLVRPCIGNSNWGGMNTNTCGGPSQTLEVLCE